MASPIVKSARHHFTWFLISIQLLGCGIDSPRTALQQNIDAALTESDNTAPIIDPQVALTLFTGIDTITMLPIPIEVNSNRLNAGNLNTAFLGVPGIPVPYDPLDPLFDPLNPFFLPPAPVTYYQGQIDLATGIVNFQTIPPITAQLLPQPWPIQFPSLATTITETHIKNVVFQNRVTLESAQKYTIVDGPVTFSDGLTMEQDTVMVLNSAGEVTIPVNKTEQLNGAALILKDKAKLVLNGQINTKNSLLATGLKKSDTTTVDGFGSVRLDPSVFYNKGITTFNPELVFGSATDSYNVFVADAGSQLRVNNTVTFNNKNIFVITYQSNSISTDALRDIFVANAMIAGVNSSGGFDHIFTLALNEDGSSSGILQPIDATVTNNSSTYGFKTVQTSTGINLEIASGVEASAGSNMDSVVQEILNANPMFTSFLSYNSTASSHSYRLENIANALSNAFSASRSSLQSPTDQINDEFKFSSIRLSKNMSPEQKMESVFQALTENGPLERRNDQYRFWISPFSHQANEWGENANRSWLLGSLAGAEYRNKVHKYTIGLLAGGNFGNQRIKNHNLEGSNLKGANIGTYASYGAWDGGRIDGLYVKSLNWIKESRFAGLDGIALNDHKATVDMIDLQASQLFKIPGDNWSLRLNLGHTYTYTNSKGYKEYNVLRPRAVNDSIGRSYELYGGVGLRHNVRSKDWRTRITGLYEYGAEYKKRQSRVRTSHGPSLNIHTFSKNDQRKERTHYASLYTSINNNDGWKFMIGYQGGFKKNSTDTSIYTKAEYRF